MNYTAKEYADAAVKANAENKMIKIIDDKIVLVDINSEQLDDYLEKQKEVEQ